MDPRGVLLDIDGVIVLAWEPLAGSLDAVERIRSSGMQVRFVTNTTSRSAAQIAASLRSAGLELEDDELITAGVATREFLESEHPGASCLVLNDGSMDDLAGIRLVEPDDSSVADVVVIGSGGPGFAWEHINRALRALLDGAVLVAMHGSLVWRSAEGVSVDGGAYAQMLARCADVEAVVVGKPSPRLFLAGCASMDCEPAEVVMVGDDVHSDVLAAQDAGLTGILVRTGKFRPKVLEGLSTPPDSIVDSLAEVPQVLGLGSQE